jgi:hypothetical protein
MFLIFDVNRRQPFKTLHFIKRQHDEILLSAKIEDEKSKPQKIFHIEDLNQ